MTTTETTSARAEDITWDLEPLVFDKGTDGVDDLMARADSLAEELKSAHGRVASFGPEDLKSFMTTSAELADLVGRAGSYASLRFAADMTDPAHGALMQSVEERTTQVATKLLFFELEWAALEEEQAEKLLAGDDLDFCRHYLRSVRRYRDYLLTEPEEKILTEKSVTGTSAWNRLFSELSSAIVVKIDGEEKPLEEGLSMLSSPDREVRRKAADAVTAGLEPGLKTRGYVFNTLLHDKATNDRLRGYEHWLRSRNLSNEASDESVEALVSAVRGRYDIAQRWYRLKAKLIGVDVLADYDRNASLDATDETVEWPRAKEIVLDGYRSFSDELADLCEEFFDDRWIDAPVRPGKRPGAFCSYTVPSHHPYVFLNYTSRRRDVLTLAHELGHGVHAALARPQGPFHQSTPLTLAETASVFGETVIFGRLLGMTDDPESRLSLLAENVEGAIATVFRQVSMNRFENLVHNARRSEGELSIERFGDLWEESQREMFADTIQITPGYRNWWSYVPHFIGVPGYVYAYAYGQLLALSVYKQYEERGADFVPSYLELLSAGGSMPPEELGKIVDVDLTDPGFWDGGLAIIEKDLRLAEDAAKEARGITLD
ncbi:MAG: M3 family oligoendopeptidase [Actinobacteria bacterium]|nr:M3 family oligoendopeptidase [Actinomycetota bacterium]